ncbi:hypothetical protein CGGC5_v004982 [Colletotrichum fructicola Nara gc5]|uniref:Heterokaryon incompatibility domain-containing protein n=1 Tax=Colletotrichum fructicola (strain Nara gc5) TaxID=1213859 RepID=A0A7J6JB68_COLFN|nr:hypothetical protein CFRS1_v005823 [Colletotrichum fructicola]KAF4487237.1 hypothetical protein CGGC5_v004982 [Colletotrichum fructicola Nara gc5]
MSSCNVCYDLEPSSEHPSNGYVYKISDIQNASYNGCKTCKLLLNSCIGLLGESFSSLDYNIKIRLCSEREPHFQTENFVIWGFGMGCTHVKPSEENCPWAGKSLEPAKGCCVNLDDYIHFIRANLAICAGSHKLCSSISASKTSYTPTRLVHVGSFEHDVFLVETGDQGKAYGDYCNYVALSHCWGQHQPAKTTKATLGRYKSRLIWADLPKTFQDAITVTRALGIDFIWVDSLCIIQDDPDDWAKEASQMASIYRKAYITIAATSAAGGEEGFLYDRRRRIYKSTAESASVAARFRAHTSRWKSERSSRVPHQPACRRYGQRFLKSIVNDNLRFRKTDYQHFQALLKTLTDTG